MSKRQHKGPVTAEQLMAELEADPEWRRRRDSEDEALGAVVETNKRDEEPLRKELAAIGFEVDAVPDLYNRRMKYASAIPLLLEWLPRVANPDVKESVIRALSVRWARPAAAGPMLKELRRLRNTDASGLRFAVANALSEVADDSVFDEIVRAIHDPALPVADRGALVRALRNMRANRERAIEVLRNLLDGDVAPQAVAALGDLRAEETRAELEPFVDHPESWVRDEARRALRKLDTVSDRGQV